MFCLGLMVHTWLDLAYIGILDGILNVSCLAPAVVVVRLGFFTILVYVGALIKHGCKAIEEVVEG
jgi:hypothetical protein